MRELYHRHPAFYLFDRYKPYHRLCRMSPSTTRALSGPGSSEVVVWRIGRGIQVGVLKGIADLLVAYDRPTADFATDVQRVLREWMSEYPAHRGGLVDAAGVWGGEMEMVAEPRIEAMWERWVWRQNRIRALRAYGRAVEVQLAVGGPPPDRHLFGIASADAKELRSRVRSGIDARGDRFDARRLAVDDLV